MADRGKKKDSAKQVPAELSPKSQKPKAKSQKPKASATVKVYEPATQKSFEVQIDLPSAPVMPSLQPEIVISQAKDSATSDNV